MPKPLIVEQVAVGAGLPWHRVCVKEWVRRVRAASITGAAVVLVLAGARLLGPGGDDKARVDTAGSLDAGDRIVGLVPLLLEDGDVTGVVPGLVAKTDYSTGEHYGQVRDEELVGPTGRASAGVVRQWTNDRGPSRGGEVRTVISTVLEYPTPEAARDAAAAVLAALDGETLDLATTSVRGEVTRPGADSEGSDGVGVTTTGPLVVAVQVGFAGEADRRALVGLVEALDERVTDVAGSDVQSTDRGAPVPGQNGLGFEPFTMRYRTSSDSGTAVVEAEWVLDYESIDEWSMELLAITGDGGGAMAPGARQTLSNGSLTHSFGPNEPGQPENVDEPVAPLAILSRGPLPVGQVDELFGQPVEATTLDGRVGYESKSVRDCPRGSVADTPGCSRPGEQITVVDFYEFNADGVPVFALTYAEDSGHTIWRFEALSYERRDGSEPDETVRDEFALWPETSRAQLPAQEPGWSASPDDTAITFARSLLGWDDAAVVRSEREDAFGDGGRSLLVESDARAAVVQVYVAQRVGKAYRVVGVRQAGREGYASVSVQGTTARADAGPPPDQAVTRSVRFDYAGQVTEGPGGRAVQLPDPPTAPGSVIVLYRDASGEVVGAWGTTLPAGDFAAG